MKNCILLFILTLSISLLSAQNKEEEAIKKVCIAESQAYADLDYDAYASYHTQSADEQLVLNNPNGTYSSRVGWDSISTVVKRQIQAGKKENVSKVFGDNFTIVIHGDMAFAAYDGSVQRANSKTLKMRENRTLIFTAGQWKILAVQVFIDYTSVK
jgi:ketosteroid isomerase-like protein